MRTLEEPAADPRARLTPLRLILLAGACLIAPAIRFADSLHNPDVLVLIVASAVLFLLVVARMAGLVRQEERAVSRERALRGAGVDLVAAADQEQVAAAAISAVHFVYSVLRRPLRLVLVREGEAVVAAVVRRRHRRTTERRDPRLAQAGCVRLAPHRGHGSSPPTFGPTST